MRFPLADQFIDCAPLRDHKAGPEALASLATRAAKALDQHGFIVFRIGALRLGETESRAMAHALSDALRLALVEAGAPENMVLEIDKAQPTPVPEAFATRTALPHHDGQHSSYLTPSLLDVADWDPELRTFSTSGYTTTHTHKLYQGILITDPGEALSVTTYYDWLRVLRDVHRSRFGAADTDPVAVQRWLGGNLRRSIEAGAKNGSAYPTLAGMLGLAEEPLLATALFCAEDDVPESAKQRFPLLRSLSAQCPCRQCLGETRRVMCHVTTLGAGLTWPEFREKYEICAPSERFDLLVGHNLGMHHGGLAGGRGRMIEPLCYVVDEPRGSVYESWLARSWRRPSSPSGECR